MVANVLQLAPQGKGKKTKKPSLIQDKVQLEKAKIKKNVQFATLLNEKAEKASKTSKEILAPLIQSPKSSKTASQSKQDPRVEFAQNAPKAKKPKFQEAKAMPEELVSLALSQEMGQKNATQLEMRAKKLKSSKRPATQEMQKIVQNPQLPTHKSTQEQLSLQTKTPRNKPSAPLKEVLQTPLQPQKLQNQKTLADVSKLAQNLNLTKLELKESPAQEVAQKPQIAVSKNTKTPRASLLEIPKEKKPKIQEAPKLDKVQAVRDEGAIPPVAQELPKESKIKDVGLSELLKVASKEKTENSEEKIAQEEKKSEKSQDLGVGELKREMQFKIASSKETLTHFSQRLREEVLNYKPPFSKLTMELNPVELGKLEITITKKGKELVVNVNANNANALQAFMQNQSEFRATLSNVGFSNVELNFSQGEGKGNGSQSQEQGQQKRNKNSLEENITEIPALASMEIKMVQYA